MSLAAGDARFLSWGVYLEPYESIDRIRYILFYDIRNHKLLLINSSLSSSQPSSYDFTCVSRCQSSDNDETELILDLDNTKQSYTVNFFFDSEYDRDCNYKLLLGIINQNVLQIAPKYGLNADLEIGCQIQKIQRKHIDHDADKETSKIVAQDKDSTITSEWKPRILSLIQNRILLFRDKTIDYHPLTMISINAASFRYYKTELYDDTVQIWLSNNLMYQFHLGDKKAMNALNGKLRSALSLYNQYGLNRFHPEKIAPKHLVSHLNNDFSSDDDGPDLPKSPELLKKHISTKTHQIISPSAKTEITQLTQQNEQQTEEAVFKAHEYMQSDTDQEATGTDDESSDAETDTDSLNEAADGDINNSDSDDPKIAKPETAHDRTGGGGGHGRHGGGNNLATIFTFRPSKKLKSRPLPPRPISTTAAAKPSGGKPRAGAGNMSIKLPSNVPPAIVTNTNTNTNTNKPSPSPSHQLSQLSPITPSKRERRLSEPDYGAIFSAASGGNGNNYRYHHTPHFSNQTECKLQQPISPVFDQAEVVKHVQASGAATPTPLQQSTQPSLDNNEADIQNPSSSKSKSKTKENINKEGNNLKINALTLTTKKVQHNHSANNGVEPHIIRNQSRNLSLSVNEPDISRRKSTKKFGDADIDGTAATGDGTTNTIQAYARGSIDNLQKNDDNKPVIFNKGFVANVDGKVIHHSELDKNGKRVSKSNKKKNKNKTKHKDKDKDGHKDRKKSKSKTKTKSKSKSKSKSKKKMKKPTLKTDNSGDYESICGIDNCKCDTFIESTGWNIGQCKSCGHDEKDHDEVLNKKKKPSKSKVKPIAKILQRRSKSSKQDGEGSGSGTNTNTKSRHERSPKHRAVTKDAHASMKSGLKRRSALVIGNESTIRKTKEKVTPKRQSSFLPRRPLPVLPMDKTTSDMNREKEKAQLMLMPIESPRLSNQSISEPHMIMSSLEVAKPVSMDKAKRASKARSPIKKAEKLNLQGRDSGHGHGGHGNGTKHSPSLDRLSPNMSPLSGRGHGGHGHGINHRKGSSPHTHSSNGHSHHSHGSRPMSPMSQLTPPPAYGSPDTNLTISASHNSPSPSRNSNPWDNRPHTPSAHMNQLTIGSDIIGNPQKKRSKSTGNVVRQVKQQIRYTQKRKSTGPQTSDKRDRDRDSGKDDTKSRQKGKGSAHRYQTQKSRTPNMQYAYSAKSPPQYPQRSGYNQQYSMFSPQGNGTNSPQPLGPNGYQHYKNQFTYMNHYNNSPQPPPVHSPYNSQHAVHGSMSTRATGKGLNTNQGQGQGQGHIHANSSFFNFPTLQGPIPPPPPTEDPEPTEEKKQQIKRLKALKWDRALKKDKSKINTFIWGKCNPQTMFPSFSYPTTPWNCDNLSKKQIHHISVSKEGGHCIGIGANDWCFVWGEASYIGVLGLGTNTSATTPFLVRSLRREKVKQTACSAFHSLCITENMVIYAWGSKQLTLLGVDTNEPTPLQFLNGKGLKCLSACNTHSLAWNPKSIHIYSFGIAGPWLGFDDDNKYSIHKATFGIIKFDNYIYNKKFVVSQADCSSQYTIIVLNTGYVGVCGINEHGRMGIGKHVVKSGKVLWMRDLHKIVRVSCASFHAGFVDTKGKVYTTGVGNDYRLGHGDCESKWKPRLVESIQNIKIREIECVAERTYVVSTAGHLLLWGKEPLTNRTHYAPFIYNYLSSYRVFNVLGAKEFAVVQGLPTKEPLETPDIVGLNESRDQGKHDKILGISSFLSGNSSRIGGKSLFGSSNPSVATILPTSPQQSNAFWSNNNSSNDIPPAPPIPFGPSNDYQNPNTHNFKRHYYRNKSKRNRTKGVKNDEIESKYEVEDDDNKYGNHIYRQRSEVQTTINFGHNSHLNDAHIRKRYANKYGNAKSDKILGITASRNAKTPKMSDDSMELELDVDMDTDDEDYHDNDEHEINIDENHNDEEKQSELDNPETPKGPVTPENHSMDSIKITTEQIKDETKKDQDEDKKHKKDKKDKKKKKRHNFTTRLKRAKTDNLGKKTTIVHNYTSRLKRADTSPFQSTDDNDLQLNQSKSLPSPTPKKCSHAGCGCAQYVRSNSKWGKKDKCKRCSHKQKEHNIQISIKSDSEEPPETMEDGDGTGGNRTYNYFPNHRFI